MRRYRTSTTLKYDHRHHLPCIYVIHGPAYSTNSPTVVHTHHILWPQYTADHRSAADCSTSAVIDQIVKDIILESSTCPSSPSTINLSNGFRKPWILRKPLSRFQSAKKTYCFIYASVISGSSLHWQYLTKCAKQPSSSLHVFLRCSMRPSSHSKIIS